ncbi:FAD/NAD(P)-binding domain-containing protein [Auricularia subglabra TFB-10046 SS5]|nr:FAD/NAD(P)-binding domain-containing protein [Auricularia subglabra TFB-10046 SS5]
MDSTHFDVLVLSTDLAASIAAAALSKAGLRVLHVDENEYYGGAHASLAPDELLRHPACASASPPAQPPPYARQYAIALAPAVIRATGPLITSIVQSGVSKYGGYKLLDALAVAPAPEGPLRAVPGSKEDVFRSKDLSLPDKHRLMKFLLFAAGEDELPEADAQRPFGEYLRETFKLPDQTADAVVYAIAQCNSAQGMSLKSAGSALARTRAFIRSSGRYGNSPFLLPYYGGLGEIAQGFCRTCAVHGGVYILGHRILSLSHSDPDSKWSITLDGIPDTLTASVLLSPRPPRPDQSLACSVALTSHPVTLAGQEQPVDDALVVFPPPSPDASVVRALITGPKSMSAPPNNWVIHVFTASPSPSTSLQPYLSTLLGAGHTPTFDVSFTQPAQVTRDDADVLLDVLPLAVPAELGDAAAVAAEKAFWEVIKRVKGEESDVVDFWPEEEKDADAQDDEDW